MHYPLVSIIVPTYNYAHFLPYTLKSVLSQNVRNYELIIVDDGSTDNTREIVKTFLSARVKYIYQANSGLSAARNTGIRASKGEFVQFLDSDDMLDKYSLEARLTCLLENPNYSISVCNTKYFKETQHGLPKPMYFSGWPLYSSHLDVHFCYSNIAPPHAFLFRRTVIEQTGFFDTNLKACEDYDYWLRALILGNIPIYCEKGHVYYRQHAMSMSSNLIPQYTHDNILHQRLKNILQEKPEVFQGMKIYEALMAFIAGTLRTIVHLCEKTAESPKELKDICIWGIRSLNNIDSSNDVEWSLLLQLYYVRSLYNLQQISQIQSSVSISLYEELINAVINFKSPYNLSYVYRNSLYFALKPGDGNFMERYRLLKFARKLKQ